MYSKFVLRIPSGWSLMLLLALPLWFGSCKKDDADEEVTPASVQGDWKIASGKITPAALGISDIVAFINALTNSTCLTDITISIKSAGTITTDNPASCQSLDPDDLSEFGFVTNNSKWKLNGRKMTVTDADGEVTEYDVTVNGGNMQWSYSEEDDFNNDGKNEKYVYTLELRRK